VAIGHTPETEVFEGKLERDEKGYIIVHNRTKTNIPGVFVAGDVHDYHYKQAVTAAGFGCMAAFDALNFLEEIKS
jgi:thioredoxin reductase (NADPH)